jgi:TonB family protein
MRFSLAATVVVGVVLGAFAPSVAGAQGIEVRGPPPPTPAGTSRPAAPVVSPPVKKKDDGPIYPKQALDEGFGGEADVTLKITIDTNGAVTGAVVETPVGHGFDEAAIAAAQKLEFEPATRDGKPIPVVIRFHYHFTPPHAALSGRVVKAGVERPLPGATVIVRDKDGKERTAVTGADGAWRIADLPAGTYHLKVTAAGMLPHETDESVNPGEEAVAVDRLQPEAAAPTTPAPAASGTTQKAEEAPEEVEVHGEKPPREVTKRTLDQREINRIPGTGGDALRSLQNLPGVARAPGLAGILIVRGSAPQDTVYFIDGTPVPLVYHFGGLSSVVPTEMIDRIDFYPGNFGAQYGRALGGVVDVGLIDPKGDKLHGLAEVDLLDSRLVAQGPIGDTGWKFAVGGRRSYFDLWLGPVLQATGAGVSVAPVYYDYQAILSKDIDKRSNIRFAFFGSDDQFKILTKTANASDPTLSGTIGTHTGFWRGQILYRNKLSDTTELRLNLAAGEDYMELFLGNIFFDLYDYPVTGRAEIAEKLGPHLTMNLGTDFIYAPYNAAAQFPPPPVPGQPPPGPFSAQPLRATTASGSVFEPAFYAEFEATPWRGGRIVPGIRLDYADNTKSWDLAPRIIARQDVTSEPRTTLKGGIGVYDQPPTPEQTNPVFGMVGLVSERSVQYDLGVEREFTRYIEGSLEGFYKQLDDLVITGLGNTGTGVVYGGELLLRYKPDDRFFGWLSYTLSQSLRRNAPGQPLRTFQFDETHVLTAIGSYRLGDGWEFGARFRLASGYMYTPSQYGFYDENVGTPVALSAYPPFGSRLPLFHSLDLRVDKTWKTKWGKLGMYLDVLNVYNQANVDGYSYNYNFTQSTIAQDLPILPSLGIRGEF